MSTRSRPALSPCAHPLVTALRAALRPSPNSAGLLGLGLVALHGPVLGQRLELSALDGTNGFFLYGTAILDTFGRSVSGAGDINGDGLDDLVIGSDGASPDGRTGAGEVYVVFGRTDGFPALLELSALDGTNGFVLNGIDPSDRSGGSVSEAADVNGDSIDDLIIGARFADPGGESDAGESYVVFGRTDGFPAALELSLLDGASGFVLNGAEAGDFSGNAVSGAGDVNGDGIDDIVIGAPGADPGGRDSAGASYVVFGRQEAFAAVVELSALDGTDGVVLNGADTLDSLGSSVSGAGDINGDGIDDIAIAAPGADPGGRTAAGQTYVVFGRTEAFGPTLELSVLDGTNGVVLNGIAAYDLAGSSVSGAGDINGDTIDDLVIGASSADPGGKIDAGQSYVMFGRTDGLAAVLELSALGATSGFVLNGVDSGDFSGRSVSGAGDTNGDGIDDLLIGADFADPNGMSTAGETYVVFGRTGGLSGAFELSTLDGTNGVVLNGIDPGDSSGRTVSDAGDVNGDGLEDLAIGAKYGASYLVFGTRPARVCSAPATTIPDNDPAGVGDILTTFGSSLIADVDVEVLATHPFVGDLVFELEHTIGPASSTVTLIDRPGVPVSAAGCAGADIDAVLDDEGASPVENECADTTPTIAGDFVPNEHLSFFDGEAIGGTWTLTAIDSAPGGTGMLDEWCLVPWYQPLSPCEAVDLPLTRVLFNGAETCIGQNSLTASDIRVSAGADVAFLSPAVTLDPGFRVEAGALFSIGLPPP